jgi:hypothetical protein
MKIMHRNENNAQGADRWNNVPSFIKRKPSLSAFREAYLSQFSQAT